MRHLIAAFLLLLTCFCASGIEKQYVFYLHGAIVEGSNGTPVHPQYGKYDYYAIVDALQAKGYIVLSEIRPLATNSEQYAEKISLRADSLKKAGIRAENITVIGASKGGQIAMFVSTLQKDKKMKFVIMGGCNEYIDSNPKLDLQGHFFSVYEESDIIGKSCNTLMQASKKVSSYNEVLLHTGLKHGFLYRPLKEWMDPVSAWIESTH